MKAIAAGRPGPRAWAAVLALALLVSGGCVTVSRPPPEPGPMELPTDAMQLRSLQSRRIDGIDAPALLAAEMCVLQDLGYTVGRTDAVLGLIAASTKRSAIDTGQIVSELITTSLLDAIFPGNHDPDFDYEQDIFASVVTRPVLGQAGDPVPRTFAIRITIQRRVWDMDGDLSFSELVRDPKVYQQFFDALSKSVFLQLQAM